MNKTFSSAISRRSIAAAAAALACCAFAGWSVLHDDGVVGATKKSGFGGCTCHDFAPSESVRVWVEGPPRVRAGESALYRLVMTGGPAVTAGFDLAVGRGSLSPVDTTTKLLPSDTWLELTHAYSLPFSNDTAAWEFRYTAPADTTLDTLFSVGNSADGNGNPTGDRFNFGEDFIVDLSDDTTLDVSGELLPAKASLLQNYPNPFNPATTIEFELSGRGMVDLSVVDLAGRTVAVLASGEMEPGRHRAVWSAQALSSGIYFCRISAPGLNEVRKMLLLR